MVRRKGKSLVQVVELTFPIVSAGLLKSQGKTLTAHRVNTVDLEAKEKWVASSKLDDYEEDSWDQTLTLGTDERYVPHLWLKVVR